MPTFSQSSLDKLQTVHPDLQTLFHEVVKHRDCTITAGLRTQEEQQALYAKGRSEPGEIVTHADGVNKRSRHQDGNAVDVCPYPEMWSSEEELDKFGYFVKGIAIMMKRYGTIDNTVTWGGDWTWKDRPHWQI